MLHKFLSANRAVLINQCRIRAVQRAEPEHETAHEHGTALFFNQLISVLENDRLRGDAATPEESLSKIGQTASLYGRELQERGFTVDQVVHHYGALCQAITALAFKDAKEITANEFQTLNNCLDHAIAGAVTGFADRHDVALREDAHQTANERLGFLAHELRNDIQTATLAFAAIKHGNVGVIGATGAVLDRSLIGLRKTIDCALAEVRMTAGLPIRHELLPLAEFIEDLTHVSALEARVLGCELVVSTIPRELAIGADRELLFSAARNLLQNAFKFTKQHSQVALNAYASGERILIEVRDHCGGLQPGAAEKMFLPFTQSGKNRTGLGLGLSIARRCVEANDGVLSVRDIPGVGCAFTISLPRRALPHWTLSGAQANSPLVIGRQPAEGTVPGGGERGRRAGG